MFFRNLILFVIAPTVLDKTINGVSTFDLRLYENALKPVGPLELSSTGWAPFPGSPPAGEAPKRAFWVEDAILLAMGTETRMLPSSVLNKALGDKLAAIEKTEGRKPGGRARKAIKEQLVHEMLPKAFVKPSTALGFIDLKLGLIGVDTSSRKVAESFVSLLRTTLGSMPALPLQAGRSVPGWFRQMLDPDGPIDRNFATGERATFKSVSGGEGTVRITNELLVPNETVDSCLERGLQPTKLQLHLGDHVAFELNEALTLSGIKLMDGALESLERLDGEDLHAELCARAELQQRAFRKVVLALRPNLELQLAEG